MTNSELLTLQQDRVNELTNEMNRIAQAAAQQAAAPYQAAIGEVQRVIAMLLPAPTASPTEWSTVK